MRLNTLKLERFGPFIGEMLSFRRGAKLHIVYVRNEAGKSCALAALTDLFFGIERQTKY
ncbi:MAG: AAA family ATPase, partial [Hyphomicrobiaceae bacterium]